MSAQEEIITNIFEKVLNEWVSLHNEEVYFKGWDPHVPAIKLCSSTLRIRANNAWSKLDKEDKEVMVAHEMGHREYQHYLLKEPMIDRFLSLVLDKKAYEPELQADDYACKLLGKEKVLRCLKRRFEDPVDNLVSKYELILRIKFIEEGG